MEVGGLGAAAFEECLGLGEEAFGFRAALAVALGFGFEFLEEFALALGEVLGGFDGDLDVHVAAGGAAEHGEALAAEAKLFAGLGAWRDLHAGLGAEEREVLAIVAVFAKLLRHFFGASAEEEMGAHRGADL